MSNHSYQDKFGSIELTLTNNVIVAQFVGSVSVGIAKFLLNTGYELAQKVQVEHWGYISDSARAEAATPDAQMILLEAAAKFSQAGCVKAAFVLTSPIAIAQMKKLRASVGVTEPFENVLFDTLPQAEAYLEQFLLNYQPTLE